MITLNDIAYAPAFNREDVVFHSLPGSGNATLTSKPWAINNLPDVLQNGIE